MKRNPHAYGVAYAGRAAGLVLSIGPAMWLAPTRKIAQSDPQPGCQTAKHKLPPSSVTRPPPPAPPPAVLFDGFEGQHDRLNCVDEYGQQVDALPQQAWDVLNWTAGALEHAANDAEWSHQGLQCLETGLRLLCRVGPA